MALLDIPGISASQLDNWIDDGSELEDDDPTSCSSPGPSGCGECDYCIAWADDMEGTYMYRDEEDYPNLSEVAFA